MHIELPEGPLRGLRDFLKHYLMIVLSILTALGLEAWIEHAHRRHAADESSAQIESEIRINLAETQASLAKDARQAKVLADLRDTLMQDVRSNVPENNIRAHILALNARHPLTLNLDWPTLRHEAWDVAVANQSASWIESNRMRRYSAAYASQRDTVAALNANVSLAMNGPRMIDIMTDLKTGDVQPRDFLRVIGQMATVLDQARGSLDALTSQLEKALPATSAG